MPRPNMLIPRTNEGARRSYWTRQMESAYEFMSKMLEYPVEECGESLVSLPEAVKAHGVAVQFSLTKLAAKHHRLFYLRKGLIESFIAAAREMNDGGWTLRVEDGFRTREMQKDLALQKNVFEKILQRVIWETKEKMPEPKLVLRRLIGLIASCPKIGTHMSGSAIDISVLNTADLSAIERSGSYLELSELTPMASPFASEIAIRNRTEIREIMQRHGFKAYPYEFWHYSKGDAYAECLANSGSPAQYGPVDCDLASGNITPISSPKTPLYALGDIEQQIEFSLNSVPCKLQEMRA